jgi:predicted helicase
MKNARRRRHECTNCQHLGDKKDDIAVTLFENYSRGLETNRDAWCYNASQSALLHNIQNMVSFYNAEVRRYQAVCIGLSKDQYPDADDFICVFHANWTVGA